MNKRAQSTVVNDMHVDARSTHELLYVDELLAVPATFVRQRTNPQLPVHEDRDRRRLIGSHMAPQGQDPLAQVPTFHVNSIDVAPARDQNHLAP